MHGERITVGNGRGFKGIKAAQIKRIVAQAMAVDTIATIVAFVSSARRPAAIAVGICGGGFRGVGMKIRPAGARGKHSRAKDEEHNACDESNPASNHAGHYIWKNSIIKMFHA